MRRAFSQLQYIIILGSKRRPLTREIQATTVTTTRMAFVTFLFPETLSVCSARGHSVRGPTLPCMANSRRGTAMHAAVVAYSVRPAMSVFLGCVVCRHGQDLQVPRWLATQYDRKGNAYACSANMVFHRRIFVSDIIISKALLFRAPY